jgi:glutathione peroxidase
MSSLYDIPVECLDGQKSTLASYRGQVILIVNVASQCGFTPQYEGLQHLYQQYRAQGFVVLGFPCNQFGNQEPGNAAEIEQFCQLNFGVQFPLFAKVEVKGEQAHPLFVYLTAAKRGVLGTRQIKWNFTKFLINRQGEVVARFSPFSQPTDLARQIESLL